MLPADEPTALRLFVAGSAARHPLSNLPLRSSHGQFSENYFPIRKGIMGVLRLPLLHMVTEEHLIAYSWFDQGPLYTTFGSWRGKVPEPKSSDPVPSHLGKQQFALHAANSRRRQDAQQRLASLVALAGPVWQAELAKVHRGRGRPAHRCNLEKTLRKSYGVSLTRHELNRLIAELKVQSPGSGS
jgi:hypothetical protein